MKVDSLIYVEHCFHFAILRRVDESDAVALRLNLHLKVDP
jgi:hypothetical protein